MGDVRLEDLPLKYRLLMAAYPWRRRTPVPRARLSKPVSESRVALVTTAGLVASGELPFDLVRRGGDSSFRVIADGTPAHALETHHRSEAFDRTAMARDLNVVFPRQILADAARAGVIGAVAPRHLSFMGSITAPGRLMREVAPEAGALFVADGVDLALLVPV
jgi:D-proline reductase (dithiol) PrdB